MAQTRRSLTAQELLALARGEEGMVLGLDDLHLELVGVRGVAVQGIGRHQGANHLAVVGVDEYRIHRDDHLGRIAGAAG